MAKILAVEDNAVNLMLLHAILTREGHQLEDATTLESARRFLGEQSFEAVLLDLRLPDGDGLELVREIRSQTALQHLPIIVVSASVLPEQQRECLQAGCTAFVGKPVMPRTLMATVTSVLQPGAPE